MSRLARTTVFFGALPLCGCASTAPPPSPLGECADPARFAYSERVSQSQLEEIREQMTASGVGDADLFPTGEESPDILNRGEVAQALEREYPPLLRGQGITGTVRMLLLLGQSGRVVIAHVSESSGHQALDEAAGRVARVIRFALPDPDGAQPICYWLPVPITFMTR